MMQQEDVEVEFADYLPVGCPPKEATAPCHTVFRLTQGAKPMSKDFVPHFLRFPGKDWGKKLCKACGVSVYTDRNDIERLKDTNGGLKDFHTAVGMLDHNSGRIMATPMNDDSHHTWWVNKDVEPEQLF